VARATQLNRWADRAMCKQMAYVAVLAVLIILLAGCAQPSSLASDELLIARVLERYQDDGGYTVVNPETTMSHLVGRWPGPLLQRDYLKEELAKEGFTAGPVVDALFKKNMKPTRLSLKSEPERGLRSRSRRTLRTLL
jgi:hypothetical protein